MPTSWDAVTQRLKLLYAGIAIGALLHDNERLFAGDFRL